MIFSLLLFEHLLSSKSDICNPLNVYSWLIFSLLLFEHLIYRNSDICNPLSSAASPLLHFKIKMNLNT